MAKIKLHRLMAIAVLIGTAAWVATGEFTSVGSAADEAAAPPAAEEKSEPEAVVRTVGVIVPKRVQHSRAIRVSGHTDADKRSVLATRTAGIVQELPVSLGQRVKAGDLVVKLESLAAEAAVETAKALVAQREAELAAAEKLAAAGQLPKLQLDNVRSGLFAAKSQLEQAVAQLDLYTLKAPFDGMIDKVNTELGSSVQPGAQVATILAMDPMLAVGEVSERDLSHVKPGDKAKVRLVNGQAVEGEIRYVSRDATAATRTYRVEVALPNPERTIPAGMTSEITLLAEPVEATILPRSVVTLSRQGDLGIRAVDKDNKVVFFPIDLVDDTPNGLVLGGIPADVRVIVAGQELITEGDTVNPVEADQETMRRIMGEAGPSL
jgi:multidrug efflux system membrane fusion protein